MEIALVFPIFLLLFLGVIWLGLSFHAKTALSSSLNAGVRLAATRGDPLRSPVTPELTDQIVSWITTDSITAVNGYIAILDKLATPDILTGADPFGPTGWYTSTWNYTLLTPNGASFGASFDDMPPTYILSIIYTLANLKQNLGTLRYPCNPYGNGPLDGSKCVRCTNLNSTSRSICPPGGPSEWDPLTQTCNGATLPIGAQLGEVGYKRSLVGVYCEHRPDFGLMEPILALIQTIGSPIFNSVILKEKRFFETLVPGVVIS